MENGIHNHCIFCHSEVGGVLFSSELVYSRFDLYLVSPGHVLVIPKRHISSIFDATSEEVHALWEQVIRVKEFLDGEYAPDGYNIGINDGTAAGQTIMHLHIHVIPRYVGDMEDPKGGVRGVIPEKQKY